MRRCCWSSRTRTGSTGRPRRCWRSSLGGSSPTRSCCWPPCATATRRRWPTPGCRSTGSAASTTRRPERCSTRRRRTCRRRRATGAARGGRQPARAARAAASRPPEHERLAGVAAADRAARAGVRRPRLGAARGDPARCCSSRRSTTRTPSTRSSQAAQRARRAAARTSTPLEPAVDGRRSSNSTCRRCASAIR